MRWWILVWSLFMSFNTEPLLHFGLRVQCSICSQSIPTDSIFECFNWMHDGPIEPIFISLTFHSETQSKSFFKTIKHHRRFHAFTLSRAFTENGWLVAGRRRLYSFWFLMFSSFVEWRTLQFVMVAAAPPCPPPDFGVALLVCCHRLVIQHNCYPKFQFRDHFNTHSGTRVRTHQAKRRRRQKQKTVIVFGRKRASRSFNWWWWLAGSGCCVSGGKN